MPHEFSREAHRKRMLTELKENKKSGIKCDVVVIANGCCEECEQKFKDGGRMTLEDALLKQPIPNKDCERPYHRCICLYGFVPLRDKKGSVISTEETKIGSERKRLQVRRPDTNTPNSNRKAPDETIVLTETGKTKDEGNYTLGILILILTVAAIIFMLMKSR